MLVIFFEILPALYQHIGDRLKRRPSFKVFSCKSKALCCYPWQFVPNQRQALDAEPIDLFAADSGIATHLDVVQKKIQAFRFTPHLSPLIDTHLLMDMLAG